MKKFMPLFAALALLLTIVSCGDGGSAENRQTAVTGQQQGPIFRSLGPREARELMETRKDLLLIDVRSPEELWEGVIPGSQLVPFGEIARGRMTLPTGRPLLLICAVGGRSYAVGQYFYRKGYPEIYNLQGGISAWKAAGLPLQRN
ncbi:rhodanese-like domain-containing protein [Thiovibrio sp. JS02]